MMLSDFSVLLRPAGGGSALAVAMERGYDFRGRVSTSALCSVPYNFARVGGVCERCRVTSEGVLVSVDGHGLRPGQVYAELTVRVPDADYVDGYRDISTTIYTGQTLRADMGELCELEADVVMPLLTPYEVARQAGYAGTREEYDAALAAVPAAVAAAAELRRVLELVESGGYCTKDEAADYAKAYADAAVAALPKLLRVTAEDYEAMESHDPDTLYIIADNGQQDD